MTKDEFKNTYTGGYFLRDDDKSYVSVDFFLDWMNTLEELKSINSYKREELDIEIEAAKEILKYLLTA